MSFRISLVSAVLLLGLIQSARAVPPPPNDTCAGAEIIPGDGPFPRVTSTIADVSGATMTGDPENECIDVTHSVWYRFTPTQTRLYTISAAADTASTVEDSVIGVYTAPNGCGGPYVPFDCNDDEAGLQAALANTLQAGTTYYIVASVGLIELSPGHTAIQLRISTPTPPTNDVCSAAENIPGAGPFPYLTRLTDTTLASNNNDPAWPCAQSVQRTVWYRFVPSESSIYEFSTCTTTETTMLDTTLAIYAAPDGCGGALELVGCNDSACGARARLGASLNVGMTYFVVVGEPINSEPTLGETEVQLSVIKYRPPTVMTRPASSVSTSGALLNAGINPNGLATVYWFEWGSDTNYGNVTATGNLAAGPTELAANSFISGLTAGAIYHFRAVATNSLGKTIGGNRSFAWSSTAPVLRLTKPVAGTATIRFSGGPGQLYWIDASDDAAGWTPIGSATDNGTGNFEFTDPDSATLPYRFYRAFSP